MNTVLELTITRETAMDLAVKRLIATLNAGYMPIPRAFRADKGMVVVEVQDVRHLANWKLHCDAEYVELVTKTTLDVATNLWVTRTWFTTAWNGVEFNFGFTCPADGVR